MNIKPRDYLDNYFSASLEIYSQRPEIEYKNIMLSNVRFSEVQALKIWLKWFGFQTFGPNRTKSFRFQNVLVWFSDILYGPNWTKFLYFRQRTATAELSSLPEEILIQILTLLSTRDILMNVAMTSKLFLHLSKVPGAHLTVSTSQEADDKAAVRFLRKAFLMKKLYLTDRTISSVTRKGSCEEKLLAVTKHAHLEAVIVEGRPRISLDCFNKLGRSKWWQNLKQFQLNIDEWEDGDLEDEDYAQTVATLGANGRLTRLGLGTSVMAPYHKCNHPDHGTDD